MEYKKNNSQFEDLDVIERESDDIEKSPLDKIFEESRLIIESIKKEKVLSEKRYEELLFDMKKYETENPEDVDIINDFNNIQEKIRNLYKELEGEINIEDHPSPEEIRSRLEIRTANKEEKEKLENKIPNQQKEALKVCANIFNKCDYPWYVTGSIAFLINAEDSKKQPDDIDIIFHEKDFDKISKEFENLGFKTGIAETTSCPFISGKIKIEIINEKGEKEEKEVEMEAFGQKTEDPNGLINPGAKDTKYKVIENELSETEKFSILDKEGQVELYFKNLSTEIKDFNFESALLSDPKNKSDKFINRLANLFELKGGDSVKLIREVKTLCKTPEDKLLLRNFIDISRHFKDSKVEKSGLGLTNILNEGHLQPSIENLKKEIIPEQNNLITEYRNIEEKIGNLENENKDEIIKEIQLTINSKKELIDKYTSLYKEVDKSKDLPLYIFISKFNTNFLEPFCKKLAEISQELKK
ncbi:MAG: hypothetical protein WCZ12_00080 [Patescibacteria group bacterium]